MNINEVVIASLSAAALLAAILTTRYPWLHYGQAFKLTAPSFSSRHRDHCYRYRYPSPLITSCTSSATLSIGPLHRTRLNLERYTKITHLSPTAESEPATASNETALVPGEGNDSLVLGKSNLDNEHFLHHLEHGHGNLDNERFLHHLAEFRSFRSRFGHGSVPNPYPDNPSLGHWAADLRKHEAMRKRAKPYTEPLTPYRRSLLSAAGFDFVSLTERQFRNRVTELEEFQRRFGHCMVPKKWEENVALGAWVSNLRTLYRMRQQEKIHGIIVGHQNVTENHRRQMTTTNILKQYNFPMKKKRRYPRFSRLDDERVTMLDEKSFVWSSFDKKWWMMLDWAKMYGIVNSRLKNNSHLGHAADLNYNSEHNVRMNDHALHIEGESCDHVKIHEKYCGLFERYQNNSTSDNTILLERYQKFAHSIQHGPLLPGVHPEDEILTLLSKDNTTYKQIGFDNVTQHLKVFDQSPFSPDYRIRLNDTLHRPLRVWMTNQRRNYNRLALQSNIEQSSISGSMTPQRQHALEEIQFPWSERFSNRMEEIRYRTEKEQQHERRRKKELKKELRKRQEKEKVERLVKYPSVVEPEEEDINVMALWNEEDEDEDIF